MKIEKISENKIRIIFNMSYLTENNIDLHTFMSTPLEEQELYEIILDKAQKEAGFSVDNSEITIQTLFLSNGNFVITISKYCDNQDSKLPQTKIAEAQPDFFIYKFSNQYNLDCFLLSLINNKMDLKYSTYQIKNSIFFTFEKNENININKILIILSEFAESIENSELFLAKLKECKT